MNDSLARDFSTMFQAFAVLYAREHGGYIARDGDLDDDGAGFDILWVTIPTPDGPRELGFHLDDSTGLDDIPSRRGERREVPDLDRMLEVLAAARPAAAIESGKHVPARMGPDRVAALLSEMALRVKAGDSFDGTISYRAEPFTEDFDVTAVCGVGYIDGRPNVRTIEGKRSS
jgi:hypothetical protein